MNINNCVVENVVKKITRLEDGEYEGLCVNCYKGIQDDDEEKEKKIKIRNKTGRLIKQFIKNK